MKTLTTLFFAASVTFSINANADAVHDDPAINDVFPIQSTQLQAQPVTAIPDTGKLVWSQEYEEFVNPADFNITRQDSVASVLNALDTNPPAAGSYSNEVFKWDENADEYQLQ